MKGYPVFTEQNFDQMYTKHVKRSNKYGHYLKGRKPTNEREFSELTKATLGVELHLKTARPGYYEIAEAYDDYKDLPLVKLWERKMNSQYFGAKIALQTTFGLLSTGGTARAQYGSFNVISHRDRLRLQSFWNTKLVPDEA